MIMVLLEGIDLIIRGEEEENSRPAKAERRAAFFCDLGPDIVSREKFTDYKLADFYPYLLLLPSFLLSARSKSGSYTARMLHACGAIRRYAFKKRRRKAASKVTRQEVIFLARAAWKTMHVLSLSKANRAPLTSPRQRTS